MKTLVLGLGNPILTDDGVGIHVVRAAEQAARLAGDDMPEVTFAEASIGGVRILEVLTGYDRAVLVDAILTPDGGPGEVVRLGVGELQGRRTSLHSGSTHDLTFTGALTLGRALDLPLPADNEIHIIAVEAADVLTFGEKCTPVVEQAIPRAVEMVIEALKLHEPAGHLPEGQAGGSIQGRTL